MIRVKKNKYNMAIVNRHRHNKCIATSNRFNSLTHAHEREENKLNYNYSMECSAIPQFCMKQMLSPRWKTKVSNESHLSTKDLITIDLRPWSRTNKPWKGHLRPTSVQPPLTWKPIIYFGIWHRFRECLGKFNCWSCSTIAWATGTFRWFHRLAPCFRWRRPLRDLLPIGFPWVSPIITIIIIITAAPILPLSKSPVGVYLLLLPFRFSACPLIETVLGFFAISSLDWMIMKFLGPRSILFKPSQSKIYW